MEAAVKTTNSNLPQICKIVVNSGSKRYIYAKYGENYYVFEKYGRFSKQHTITADRFLRAYNTQKAQQNIANNG